MISWKKIIGNTKITEVIMELKKCTKESFAVIGKEGSTDSGEGFIQRSWEDVNSLIN